MGFSTFSGKNLKLIYSIWFLAWMAIHAAIIHRLGHIWQVSIYDSIISNVLLLILAIASGNIMLYYQPSAKTAWKLVVWCISLAAIWVALLRFLIKLILKGETIYISNFDQSIPVRFIIAFLIIGCILLLVWIWEFVLFQKENLSRNAKAEALAKEAELTSLTQQLQPHFLFNSLNSINALIGSKPQEARKMVQQLSDFFRGTLNKKDKTSVSLDEELKHIDLYLEIEKVRFGHRLKTEFYTEENTLKCKVPHLILQPLVENAIKFGLYETLDDVKIEISSVIENDNLKIEIRNPFDSQIHSENKGMGFGLSSVSRRLYLLFSRDDLLKTSHTNNLYSSIVFIPQNL